MNYFAKAFNCKNDKWYLIWLNKSEEREKLAEFADKYLPPNNGYECDWKTTIKDDTKKVTVYAIQEDDFEKIKEEINEIAGILTDHTLFPNSKMKVRFLKNIPYPQILDLPIRKVLSDIK